MNAEVTCPQSCQRAVRSSQTDEMSVFDKSWHGSACEIREAEQRLFFDIN